MSGEFIAGSIMINDKFDTKAMAGASWFRAFLSAFLSDCRGILRLSKELQAQYVNMAADSTVFIKPRANNEGYWENCDLI